MCYILWPSLLWVLLVITVHLSSVVYCSDAVLSGELIVPRVCLFACFLSPQIGYERHWLHFLKEFIVPVNARLYPGYNSEVRINPKNHLKYLCQNLRNSWRYLVYCEVLSPGTLMCRCSVFSQTSNSLNNKRQTLTGRAEITFVARRFWWRLLSATSWCRFNSRKRFGSFTKIRRKRHWSECTATISCF